MAQLPTGLTTAPTWKRKKMQIPRELRTENVGWLSELLGLLWGPEEGAQASGLR